MRHIHIVGCSPRSGTTLLAEMMVACFDIDRYAEHERQIHCLTSGSPRVYLTKWPGDVVVADLYVRVIPRLYVVVMIRDPRDIIVSRHGLRPDRYWTGLRFWKAYLPYVRRLRGHRRVTLVRYEDLVRDPNGVQQLLLQRMPWLTRRARFSGFHEVSRPSELSRIALGGLRPVSQSSIGKWKRNKPRVAGQQMLHGPITEDLIEFGYEPDATWREELAGAGLDLAASHWREYFRPGEVACRRRAAVRALPKAILGHSVVYRTVRRFYRGVKRRVRFGLERLSSRCDAP